MYIVMVGTAVFQQMSFDSVAQLCDAVFFIDFCYKHNNHLTLLPYFHGNIFLHEKFKEQIRHNAANEIELVKSIKIFSTESGQQFSSEYNEDQWTKRLCER